MIRFVLFTVDKFGNETAVPVDAQTDNEGQVVIYTGLDADGNAIGEGKEEEQLPIFNGRIMSNLLAEWRRTKEHQLRLEQEIDEAIAAQRLVASSIKW